jgi:hypothetical protein
MSEIMPPPALAHNTSSFDAAGFSATSAWRLRLDDTGRAKAAA